MKSAILLRFLCLMVIHATTCLVILSPPISQSTALAEVLQLSHCSNLTVNMTSELPLVFESMYEIALLQLNCNGATLSIEPTLEVQQGKELRLRNCSLHGGDSGLLDVHGSVTLQDCVVRANTNYALNIEGVALVEASVFENNVKSIFVSRRLGFTLTVRNSWFENNSSPLGAVLLLRAASRKPSFPTRISFEDSIFVNNKAYIGGSFLHISVEELDMGESLEENTLVVKGCRCSDSKGYLFHMYLTYIDAIFSDDIISNVTLPFYIQLYSHSVILDNITIVSVEKAIVCPHLNGRLYANNLLLETVTQGPALLFTHTSFSPGAVFLKNLEIRNATQVDTVLYVSTLYVFNLFVSLENAKFHHSYSFAAGCGAFFFSESQVNNCSFAYSTTHQGALIGHVGGHGVASNLVLQEVYIESMNAILAMSAQVELANVSIVYSNAHRPSNFNNLLVFVDSVVKGVNISTDLLRTQTELLVKAQSSVVSLTCLRFRLLHAMTFFQAIQSNVTMTDIRADLVEVRYFASVNVDSNLRLGQVVLRNAVMLEGFVSAKTKCNVHAEQVELVWGVCQSLAISFGSKVSLTDVTMNGTSSGTLFSAHLGGEIEVTGLRVYNSTLNLISGENGRVTLISALLNEVWIEKRLILLRNATATLRNVEAQGLHCSTSFPLLLATNNSTLRIVNSFLHHIRSLEFSLMQVSNSQLTFEYTVVSDFNATFAHLSKSAFFIQDSEITYGGVSLSSRNSKRMNPAGFIDATDSVGVVSMSRFHYISGASGGVFALHSRTGTMQLTIVDSHFESCSALLLGGVISAHSAVLNISHSTFVSNSAQSGGVLYFHCEATANCSSLLSFSEFSNNSAVEGGVLKWTQIKPFLLGLTTLNNTALYGHFEASLPTRITLQSDVLTMFGVAGTRMTSPIMVASLDSLNQTVTTDNSSIIQLVSDQVVGTTVLPTLNGVANFSGVIIETAPGSSVHIQVLSPTIQQTSPDSGYSFTFVYHTRFCIPGEVTLPLSCFLCPKNTYSLDPSDSYCRECPSYASCPGGNSLILDPGYWRESAVTSKVHLCPNPESCAGGENATCAEGYSGVLCADCQEGHYHVGTVVCEQCENVALIVLRSCAVYLAAVSCMVYISNRLDTQPGRMTTVRLLTDFLHFLLLLPLIPVNYHSVMPGFLAFNEMVVSFGLHSFPLDCWVSSAFVWEAVLATAFPVGYFVFSLAVFAARSKTLNSLSLKSAVNCWLLMLWWMQPYVVKTLAGLLACKQQAGRWVLVSSTEVVCWESSHWKYLLGLFLPGFLLYCVAYPTALFYCLSQKSLCRQHFKTVYFTSGLAKHFDHEARKCLKKQILLFLAALLGAVQCLFQVLAVAGTLYCLLTWSTGKHIYLHQTHQMLSGVGLLLQIYCAAFSYYFVAKMHLNAYILTLLSSFMFALCLLYVGACLVIMRKLLSAPAPVVAEQSEESANAVSLDDIHLVPQPSPVSTPDHRTAENSPNLRRTSSYHD